MDELYTTAVMLVALGALAVVSVVFSRFIDRIGIPILLLFLVLGMLGGSEAPGGLAFENYEAAVRLATIALVLILFDGGFNTSIGSVRQVIAPAGCWRRWVSP